MNIFELTKEFVELKEMLEDSELSDELKEEALKEVKTGLEEKADAYAYIITELKSECDMLENEEKRLYRIRAAKENAVSRLKENLMFCIKETGEKNLKTSMHRFTVCKNGGKPGINLTVPVDELPDELKKVEYKPDNDKIRKMILEDGDMTYAELKPQGEHLLIK